MRVEGAATSAHAFNRLRDIALGRVGLFNGKLDSSLAGDERGTSYKVGAGVQYDFDKQLGIRGEWERYRFDALGTKSNADMVSVGLNYKF